MITTAPGQKVVILRPQVGWGITVHGIRCVITKVHGYGTVDAQAPDGQVWRVTGLPFR